MSVFFSGNPTLMRDMNRANVLDLARRMSPISQTEMAKVLGLQPSTILRIIKNLESDGLIYQVGRHEASSKGGRKAGLWALNSKGAFAIGIDLGAEEIVAVLADLVGNIVDRVVSPCPSDQSSTEVMMVVNELIEQLLNSNIKFSKKVIGIGIGLPGKVDNERGISCYALNFSNWKNVPVREIVSEKFNLPVFIEVDMQLMAFGETWLGAGSDSKNILCLGFRRGIGLGVVINGEIYRGKFQSAGDIGHVVVDPNGKLCHCGRRGCLEAVASETAILEWVHEYLKRNGVAAFNGIIGSIEEVNMSKIYEALREDNYLVVDRIKESANYIGRELCDLVRIFDPEKIIIGGKILEKSPIFLNTVIAAFKAEQPRYSEDLPEILPSKLAENSIALGASVRILSQLFHIFEHSNQSIGLAKEQ